MSRPRVGVYGLTSCAGDQLQVLNCEDELLEIARTVSLHSFAMAQSENTDAGLDLAFVEGVVATAEDAAHLKEIRANSLLLVAIGTCAAWGGVPGNHTPQSPRPLSDLVRVDGVIPGCPIEKDQFLHAVASLLHGDLPRFVSHPVCFECKFGENNCLFIEAGQACAGPLTLAGCGARCPSHGVRCRGCRGPIAEPNWTSAVQLLEAQGWGASDARRMLTTFARPQAERLMGAKEAVGK